MQLARKELALAAAVALKRWPEGSARQPGRDAAEREYADALNAIGSKVGDAALLAMAGEAYMMLSPWGYYQVRCAALRCVPPDLAACLCEHVVLFFDAHASAAAASPLLLGQSCMRCCLGVQHISPHHF